jgi:outer membrane protein OmpA-like peptidoglycan-associated protein
LEKRDSSLRAELASVDQTVLNSDDAAKSVIVCGKVIGINKTQFPIPDVSIDLIKENGDVVTEKTTNNGYFKFTGISAAENYTLRLNEEAAKIIKTDKIIITNCLGKTIMTLTKNDGRFFEYKVLEHEKSQLNMVGGDLSDSDPLMKVKTLKENYKKAQDELVVAKTCKADYDVLQEKYNQLEKKYGELKATMTVGGEADATSDDLLKDSTQRSKYIKTIRFHVNNASLDEKAMISLDGLLSQLKANKTIKFNVVGHADNSGTDSVNVALSKNRAIAVKTYLISKGMKTANFSTEWFGSTKPFAPNDTEEGRSQNRRVEIRLKRD